RWHDRKGRLLPLPEGRALLADDIAPGRATGVAFALPAPPRPGIYQLVIDVVHEGVTWFGDEAGRTATIAVQVRHRELWKRARSRVARAFGRSRSAPARSGTEIQTFGLPEDEIVARIDAAGLRILRTERDNATPGWTSATYYATR